ncbi:MULTISPECIES: hypothetical protein [unclassified Marinobacter]|uniref:hypothetical protein n=1 Tax=unclassified Marinobacter TaxID=83889 RepID=UPI001926EF7D|nr:MULTISPECIES: hypothetical protein [unclassified Marinobacter]MBL3825125.1 hypothetical protein [Marinobacter sp. MC3]MBL3893671.1 hypothetical protein [Marinobacter sp. MW3]
MKTMTPKDEIIAITRLAFEISELRPERSVHSCSIAAAGISLTVFNENNDVAWQENIYEETQGEAYLPKLRFLRHTLEQMKEDALAKREKVAA